MDAIVANVAGCRITPVGMQQYIRAQTGTSLHIKYVRKIMRLYNLSPKVAQKIHINRVNRKAVWNWRYYLKRRISCLEKDGFAVIMQDEAFFIHDTCTICGTPLPHGQVAISKTRSRKSRRYCVECDEIFYII